MLRTAQVTVTHWNAVDFISLCGCYHRVSTLYIIGRKSVKSISASLYPTIPLYLITPLWYDWIVPKLSPFKDKIAVFNHVMKVKSFSFRPLFLRVVAWSYLRSGTETTRVTVAFEVLSLQLLYTGRVCLSNLHLICLTVDRSMMRNDIFMSFLKCQQFNHLNKKIKTYLLPDD